MSVRFVLPVVALGLAVTIPGQLSAQGSSSAEIRPAQGTESGPCDDLIQRVESGMPGAVHIRVPDAQADLREAQELCNSGQPEQGRAILRQILGYIYDSP
jgi:hypothetical protein